MVKKLFEWYATGNHSLHQLTELARREGLVSRVSGGPVGTAQIHAILRNRLYTGEYEWHDIVIKGRHEPIISYNLWERVQLRLEDRGTRKLRKGPRGFPLSGLITCGHCGCAMVGEIKKAKYVYYHCTGYKGKCPEPYVREEMIDAKFTALIDRLRITEEIYQWIVDALHGSAEGERKEHDAAVHRLQAEYDRLTHRLRTMYVDKLDGRIDGVTYDDISRDWRKEQDRCLREIAAHKDAETSYMQEGIALLTMAKELPQAFAKRSLNQKRELLNFVLSNSTWRDGELTGNFRKPFDMIAEMSRPGASPGGESSPQSEGGHLNWWARQDSNLQPDRYERRDNGWLH
ncbi:recombinase family protein [Bradyrhizobium sacchari]|uniref:recombinase family protein n=1 Tax=Bradyrhizobium sacchari TaxID=1399419 RepID=UPI001FDA9196|nr:recombinase family protein [Bradyrhizobium sacchari]